MTNSDTKSCDFPTHSPLMKFPGICSQPQTSEQQLLQNLNVGFQSIVGHNLVINVDSFNGSNFAISTAISLSSQSGEGVMDTNKSEMSAIKLKGILFMNDLDFQNVQLLLSQAALLNVAQQQTATFSEMNSFQDSLASKIQQSEQIMSPENDSQTSTPQQVTNPETMEMILEQAAEEEILAEIDPEPFHKPSKQSKNGDEKKKSRKKKRKYVKSGLYRKDKNGRFIFSSANRARLSALMQTFQTDDGVEVKPEGDAVPKNESENVEAKQVAQPLENQTLEKECESNEPEFFKGFDIFFREQRALLQQQSKDGELGFEKTKKILIEQWKALPQMERLKYRAVEEKEKRLKMTIVNDEIEPTPAGNEELATDYAMLNMNMQRVKRPLNAYNIFCKLHFEEVKKKYPNYSLNKLSQIMGLKWKKMSDKEKKIYYDKVETTPRFKKPLNSYNLFCKKHFETLKKQYPNKSINELSKLIATKWKQLSFEEKKEYYEAAEQQKSQCGFAFPNEEVPNIEENALGQSFNNLQFQQQMMNVPSLDDSVALVDYNFDINTLATESEKKRGKKRTLDGHVIPSGNEDRDDCLLYLNLQPLASQLNGSDENEGSCDTEENDAFCSFFPFVAEEPAVKKPCFGLVSDISDSVEASFF